MLQKAKSFVGEYWVFLLFGWLLLSGFIGNDSIAFKSINLIILGASAILISKGIIRGIRSPRISERLGYSLTLFGGVITIGIVAADLLGYSISKLVVYLGITLLIGGMLIVTIPMLRRSQKLIDQARAQRQ